MKKVFLALTVVAVAAAFSSCASKKQCCGSCSAPMPEVVTSK